jgi:uncharacterized membrane protein YciS (DUF1049 family)
MKAFLKTLCVLVIFFAMVYMGMNNTREIDFNFPIAGTTAKSPLHAPAALIYFGVFAIGMLAGMVLHTGGGSKKKAGKD